MTPPFFTDLFVRLYAAFLTSMFGNSDGSTVNVGLKHTSDILIDFVAPKNQ